MNKDRRKRLQEICDILEEQQAALEEIRDEEQESFDNLSEGLQCTERGQALEGLFRFQNLDRGILQFPD